MMDSRKVRQALRRTVGKSNIYSGFLLLVFTLPASSHDVCFPPLSRFAVYFCHRVPRSHCDIILLVPFRALTLVTIACPRSIMHYVTIWYVINDWTR